jgi:bcr-type benzoyl-CoA reductase subunit C
MGISELWAGSLVNPYREWKKRYPDRRAFGYLCPYAPLEVLHAAGFAPVRLLQFSSPVALADAHLPSFACALARGVTERLLSGELDFLSGVVFAHTCDTMQCTADVWRLAAPHLRVVPLSLPTVLSARDSQAYWLSELHRLAELLASEFASPVTEDALRASIALYNQQRRLLASLYERRAAFTAEEVWTLTLAAMLMPVEEHVALLGPLLHTDVANTANAEGPAVLLVGAVLDEPTPLRMLQELGGRVVGDDLCTGSRCFDGLAGETGDPFAALAERYVRRASCPVKYGGPDRVNRLLELVHSGGAQGVVFLLPKFCDPHAFDYVHLSLALGQAGVPHLLLETDVTASAGQMRTRLQAFLEMLREVPKRHG